MTAATATGTRPSPGPYDDPVLRALLRIRHVELALLDLFDKGVLSGTAHTCIGQEYVPVALAPFIRGDMVFSNHRGHGHYLATCEDADGLVAEMLGRAGAVCAGVGGSQHIYRDGRYMSTGIQGESVAVAAGVALHEKRTGSGRLAVAFVGDGTWGEGVVYEALNMAALWDVPLMVVVENNGIAQTTATEAQMAGSVPARAAAFGVRYERVTSDDVGEIRRLVAGPVQRARESPSPLVLEFMTIRVGPHSKGDDTRPAEELARVRASDWAVRYRASHPEQYARIDAEQANAVHDLVTSVLSRERSVWPEISHG